MTALRVDGGVAREAGVSRVTLYRRGATRAAIVSALRERLAQEEREALWPALAGDGTARERLQAALGILCDANEQSLELLDAAPASATRSTTSPVTSL